MLKQHLDHCSHWL